MLNYSSSVPKKLKKKDEFYNCKRKFLKIERFGLTKLETFNEFLDHWYYIYIYYYSVYIIYFLLILISGILIAYIASSHLSVSNLKERYLENYSTVIITKKYVLDYFLSHSTIVFFIFLLAIIPSFIRWLLKLPAVHVNYYVLLNIVIFFLLYILFSQKIFQKFASTKYYANENWMLVISLNNFILIPLSGIRDIVIDKHHQLIRIRFYTKLFFVKLKGRFICNLSDNFEFKRLIHQFETKNLIITYKNLDTIRNKLWYNHIYLNGKFEEKDFKIFPNKVKNLLEII